MSIESDNEKWSNIHFLPFLQFLGSTRGGVKSDEPTIVGSCDHPPTSSMPHLELVFLQKRITCPTRQVEKHQEGREVSTTTQRNTKCTKK